MQLQPQPGAVTDDSPVEESGSPTRPSAALIRRRRMRRQAFRLLALLERFAPRDPRLQFSPTFIVGPPRSGSTLTRQLVAWGLPTCHFTNLVAGSRYVLKYPLPFAGALLVRSLHGSPPADRRYRRGPFRNEYGNVPGASAPAESELIWGDWFGTRYGPVDPADLSEEQIARIRRAVAVTEQVFGLPFVNKTSTLSLRIRALARIFPTALFIEVVRDPLDTAQSLFRARSTQYPGWLGARPAECEPVKGKSLRRQVCEQVHYVERRIARARRALGEDRFLSVHYQDICRNPESELDRIAAFMSDGGAPVRRIRPVPSSFRFSHGCKIDPSDYEALRRCLREVALRDGSLSSRTVTPA